MASFKEVHWRLNLESWSCRRNLRHLLRSIITKEIQILFEAVSLKQCYHVTLQCNTKGYASLYSAVHFYKGLLDGANGLFANHTVAQ